jgi:hypothetical protein
MSHLSTPKNSRAPLSYKRVLLSREKNPAPKRQVMEGDQGNVLRDIQKALLEIKGSQEALRHSFDSRMEAITTSITQSIKDLRDDIYTELARLESRVKMVEERMESLDERQGWEQEYPVETSVIVINLREEGNEDIGGKCEDLISNRLGLRDIKPVRCERLKSRSAKPSLVKIQLKTKQDKINVLRHKTELKKTEDIKRVYIRSEQSHEERLMRQNMEVLMKELPVGGNYRLAANGRLLKRENENEAEAQAPGGTGAGSQPGEGSGSGANDSTD